MPKAVAYLMKKLEEYGLTPEKRGHGVAAGVSEDFAAMADRAPSTFMYLPAGYQDDGAAPRPSKTIRSCFEDRSIFNGTMT